MSNNESSFPLTIKITNPSEWERSGLVKVTLPPNQISSDLQVYNSQGEEISSQVEKSDPASALLFNFVAEKIPPLATHHYLIKPRDRLAPLHLPLEGLLDGNDYYLENDLMRVVLEENASITIMLRNPEEESSEEEEKIFVMGEELTPGSIWAKDSFFNFRNLNRISVNSHSVALKGKSHLVEASDFKGIVECELLGGDENDKNLVVSTQFSIEKGDSPIVDFDLSLADQTAENILSVGFKLNIHPTTRITEQKYGLFWDKEKKYGILMLHSDFIKVFSNYDEEFPEITLVFDGKQNKDYTIHPHYALVPLNAAWEENGNLDMNLINRVIFDYFHPFTCTF